MSTISSSQIRASHERPWLPQAFTTSHNPQIQGCGMCPFPPPRCHEQATSTSPSETSPRPGPPWYDPPVPWQGPAAWHQPLLTSHQNKEDHGNPRTAWEVLELSKIKKALEFKVKVWPSTKVEVPIIVKIKFPVGVKVRVSAPTTEVMGLPSPRSTPCSCLHH